jgi:hypothetical protein
MFNEPVIKEEAGQKRAEREREAGAYRLHKQLGYSDGGAARWVIVFMVLVASLALIFLF